MICDLTPSCNNDFLRPNARVGTVPFLDEVTFK